MQLDGFVHTGVPHKAAGDDVYRGYLIPKGAMVIGNSWYVSSCFLSQNLGSDGFACSYTDPQVHLAQSRYLP